MWKLKCVDSEKVTEKVVKFKNIIGRSEIRTFFADNGYAMMDNEMALIRDMYTGEVLRFYFPNMIKYIEVEAI